jgi:hypothetical protein
MSSTVRRRESRKRFFKSEPSLTEEPENLKDEQKKENSKRSVAGGAGDTLASLSYPESSILLTGTDTQLQAQLTKITRLKK